MTPFREQILLRWWLPLTVLRSVLANIFFVFWTVGTSIVAIILVLVSAPRSAVDTTIVIWAEVTLWIYGVRVTEVGRENLSADSCLYIFNHTSFFDIFAMAAKLKGMRFGAKIELFKIPFFGYAMKKAGVLPIAREQREKVFRVYERAKAATAKGQQFALSPEGKRNTEEKLLPFKSGPFVFVINAQIPLAPVIIKGACAVLPNSSLLPNWRSWRAEISLQYLPRIPVDGMTLTTRSDLQKHAYLLMKPYFSEGIEESPLEPVIDQSSDSV